MKYWICGLPPSAGDASRFGEVQRVQGKWTIVRVAEDRLDEVIACGGVVY